MNSKRNTKSFFARKVKIVEVKKLSNNSFGQALHWVSCMIFKKKIVLTFYSSNQTRYWLWLLSTLTQNEYLLCPEVKIIDFEELSNNDNIIISLSFGIIIINIIALSCRCWLFKASISESRFDCTFSPKLKYLLSSVLFNCFSMAHWWILKRR